MPELLAGMPILPLLPGATVRFEAISPTTGAAVTGVLVSLAVLYAQEATGGEELGDVDSGPFMLVPGVADAPTATTKPKLTGGL